MSVQLSTSGCDRARGCSDDDVMGNPILPRTDGMRQSDRRRDSGTDVDVLVVTDAVVVMMLVLCVVWSLF